MATPAIRISPSISPNKHSTAASDKNTTSTPHRCNVVLHKLFQQTHTKTYEKDFEEIKKRSCFENRILCYVLTALSFIHHFRYLAEGDARETARYKDCISTSDHMNKKLKTESQTNCVMVERETYKFHRCRRNRNPKEIKTIEVVVEGREKC
ncbi:hypothetical protein V6N13_060753 [Hibiscus sabdariffa]|uniref:Uncharacterized protein n=1 Tax=Hibiscus sabdariffa TaxID=183260 RepID=A0ABR2P7J4_9ROSI